MKFSDYLITVKATIGTPEKWTKGLPARGADGRSCSIFEIRKAACWCTIGAILKNPHPTLPIGAVRKALWHHMPAGGPFFRDVVDFNDHPDTTHDDIMAMFDRAIAYEQSKGN